MQNILKMNSIDAIERGMQQRNQLQGRWNCVTAGHVNELTNFSLNWFTKRYLHYKTQRLTLPVISRAGQKAKFTLHANVKDTRKLKMPIQWKTFDTHRPWKIVNKEYSECTIGIRQQEAWQKKSRFNNVLNFRLHNMNFSPNLKLIQKVIKCAKGIFLIISYD